jgi:hypothetical protein
MNKLGERLWGVGLFCGPAAPNPGASRRSGLAISKLCKGIKRFLQGLFLLLILNGRLVAQTANPKPPSPPAKPSSLDALRQSRRIRVGSLARPPNGRTRHCGMVLQDELNVAILDKNTPPFAQDGGLVDGAREIVESRDMSAPEGRGNWLPVAKPPNCPRSPTDFESFEVKFHLKLTNCCATWRRVSQNILERLGAKACRL